MRLFFSLLIILSIVFLAFSPVLKNQFVNWDDDVHLLENPFLRPLDIQHIKEIFTTTVNKIYIPLTTLSFAVEYHFFKDQPFVYHLDNLLLYLGVTALVFLFCLRLEFSLAGAGLTALIFGLHPIHVQSVAWVTERKDVLYALFYMLALQSYLTHLKKGGGAAGILWTAWWGFLSLLAKPMALSLPLVLLVIDGFLRRRLTRQSLLEKVFLAVLFLPVVWVSYLPQMRSVALEFPWAFLTWIWTFVFYLRKFFFPGEFLLLYKLPDPIGLENPAYLFSLFIFLLLLAGLAIWRKNRLWLFAVGFYFASIFFLLRFDAAADAQIVIDRFMFLPCLGFCMLAAWALEQLFRRAERRVALKIAVVAFCLIVLVALAVKTHGQTKVWYNGVTLWRHQLEREPRVATALIYCKLADALRAEAKFTAASQEQREEVIGLYRRALAIKPDYANAYYGLSLVCGQDGNTFAARENFEKAVHFDPRFLKRGENPHLPFRP